MERKSNVLMMLSLLEITGAALHAVKLPLRNVQRNKNERTETIPQFPFKSNQTAHKAADISLLKGKFTLKCEVF